MPLLAGTSYCPAACDVTKPGVAYFATPGAYPSHVRVTPPTYEFYQAPIAVIPTFFGPATMPKHFPWWTPSESHTSLQFGPCYA